MSRLTPQQPDTYADGNSIMSPSRISTSALVVVLLTAQTFS